MGDHGDFCTSKMLASSLDTACQCNTIVRLSYNNYYANLSHGQVSVEWSSYSASAIFDPRSPTSF